MHVNPLRADLVTFLSKRRLSSRFQKQLAFFVNNPRHPSLHMELLEPKNLRLYSFRIDQKYRVIFLFVSEDIAEIIDINAHYQ
ncbi:type II toxin-antitoxin system mRNA interferase toxin, RelE/StbE family [Patescibacteria group bacterium]|nr:type II toxin-antitoxin system mRNA interferase toxin, RelE/StbE family [Patescibacteria group bacterium]MBU1472381.1 type II toxin-antitoxin system mRNA interferase toxin, RelE/StbE family [Patescibacteria group bacterium]